MGRGSRWVLAAGVALVSCGGSGTKNAEHDPQAGSSDATGAGGNAGSTGDQPSTTTSGTP